MPAVASPSFHFASQAALLKYEATASATVTATLDNLQGVNQVTWSVWSTDDTTDEGDYTLTPSGPKNSVCEFTAGAAGTALILQCTVNAGVDPTTDTVSEAMSARAKVWVPTAAGLEVGCFNEQYESGEQGWLAQHNAAIRTASAGAPTSRILTAGAGLTGGGDLSADRTFNVVANADASIVVNANDIQVGVLATDGQHGTRGGGSLHANVVAAGAAGFMTGADKTKLDGITAGASIVAINVSTPITTTGGTSPTIGIDATEDPTASYVALRGSGGRCAFARLAPTWSGVAATGWLALTGASQKVMVANSATPGTDLDIIALNGADGLLIGDDGFASVTVLAGEATLRATSGALQIVGAGVASVDAVTSWDMLVNGVSRLKFNATGLGFFTTTPVAKQEVTGSCRGNTALIDLVADLARYGFVTNSTTTGNGLDISVRVDTGTTVTVLDTDEMVVLNNASPVTVNLPAGSANARKKFKNKGAGTATLTPDGAEKLFTTVQVGSLNMVTGDAVEIAWDGTDWSVV